MTDYSHIPMWLAVPVAFFLILGATLTMLGALGLARLGSFYDRIHAPTLGSSWGTAGILMASILLYSYSAGYLVIHDLVIGIFIMITTPVTLMILGRTALHRDHMELEDGQGAPWSEPSQSKLDALEVKAEAEDARDDGDPASDFSADADVDEPPPTSTPDPAPKPAS